MSLQSFASEFLTFIERREERLLTWGFHNIRQTGQEIEDALLQESPERLRQDWSELQNQGHTVRGLLQQMHQRRLLYLVPGGVDAYRTRFAEGIRLMANLRQMFTFSDWATGPRLVSDIKIHLAPRTYPRRDRVAASVWQKLRPLCSPNQVALLEQCFLSLTAGRDGAALNFSGFQERAFEHIFRKYGETGISGSVVCAGTGAGKTKAFYIPGFLRVVTELNSPPFTKVIAVYPRNVLLADQLREAIGEAEKLRPVLQAAGLRAIRFGALLGTTPWSRYFDPVPNGQRRPSYHWEQRRNGFVIPHLRSPVDGRSDLVWRDADRQAGHTCLYRDGQNQPDIANGVIAITREQLIDNPPDILFLSLEMLNREMGNPQWQRTLGLRQGIRAPRLMLLDEVHAYEGVHGAQVAWVLRRWRHWAQARAFHVVGLSATLRDASEHLARVASLPPGQVIEFRPVPGFSAPGEMESEGAEYNLAVKGDPAAGASLLATSIQTGMLLARLLTPRNQPNSPTAQSLRPDVFYRRKVFGFSDNLDSINRWFSDMSDAEANRRLPRLRLPLHLRQPPPNPPISAAVQRRMAEEGQIWELPTLLGYDLQQPLVVTRCSSQDPGADVNSDLIIATSSLEVGFDDPDVGAILHHKRPVSMASFIQRKGRAGRTRDSRPWTVVVLSDYGADRWAFHSAERLFQPQIESLFLPITNPYVLRVQMALFLVDWLGQRINGVQSPFQYLAGPSSNAGIRQAQQTAMTLLRGILELGATWQEFRRDLLRFYQYSSNVRDAEIASSQLDDLLWHEPRPLLTQAIPALLRKLEVDWRRADGSGISNLEDAGAGRPMPQFIPKATFMDLDVNEGVVELEAFGNLQREPETLAIGRLLAEACPGRVSKRFASIPSEPGYWHEFSPQLAAGVNPISLRQLFPQSRFLEAVGNFHVYQPETVNLIHRPATVTDSSNSSWEWQTLGRSIGAAELLPLRAENPWRNVFLEATCFVHANNAWLELLRYANCCRFEIRNQQQQQSTKGTLILGTRLEPNPPVQEAVGFRIRADGLRFVLAPQHLASRPGPSAETTTRFRADYFLHGLKTSAVLRDLINPFQAEWMAQTSLAMLTATALRHSETLSAAQRRLSGNRSAAAANVLDVIFQVRGITPTGQAQDAKLRQTLLNLWSDQTTVQETERVESVLWQPADAAFDAWMQQRYLATLAQALRYAMCSMSDQVADDDIVVDILRSEGNVEIFLTEQSSGGLGQIEAIVREIKQNPRRFLDAMEHSLNSCRRNEVSADLLAVLEAVVTQTRTGGPLATAFGSVRGASGFTELAESKDRLCAALQNEGFAVRRSTVVSIVMKLLRPGSSPIADGLILGLNRAWTRRSLQVGLHIPLRTFAYMGTHYAPLQRRLENLFAAIGTGGIPTPPQLYAQVQQILLECCHDSCPECLDQPNPLNDFGKPSRSLALAWLGLEVEELSLDSNPLDWLERSRATLRRRGRVCVTAREERRAELLRGLRLLINEELDREELLVPVSIARAERRQGLLKVILHVKDFIHV